MTIQPETIQDSDAVRLIPLGKLKKSPRNARRTPHPAEAIEALAASIAAKGMIQPPVVEPERDEDGVPNGFYWVTIGEGRRQAMLLRLKRKEIKKSELIRCIVDAANDAHEISLDENITRTNMHPADQFEAFQRLAEERGYGAEEIAARFGVSPGVVRQRLRLAAVSPTLIQAYRDEQLTLEQLMAFAVSDDHERQEQVFAALSWNRSAALIRRSLTEVHVAARDPRGVFVGVEAYLAEGGTILRDLFTEDGGGWFTDPALLDAMALQRLQALADEVKDREGWLWAEASIEFPHGHGLRRLYPHPVARTEAEVAKIDALNEEYEQLLAPWESLEDIPEEAAERLAVIDAALAMFGDDHAYDDSDRERAGLFVFLDHRGEARLERGFVRTEDEAASEYADDTPHAKGRPGAPPDEEVADDAVSPLPERLVADLTAHRTAAMRDALADNPAIALLALIHAMVLRLFYAADALATCLDVRPVSAYLTKDAPGIEASRAAIRIGERHEAWAKRMPRAAAEVWAWVIGLEGGERASLLAHCTGLTVNAVQGWERRPAALAHADRLAQAIGLNMADYWTADAQTYLGRVTKARILQAVSEAVGDEAATRIADLKKAEMVAAAEALLQDTGWLPGVLGAPADEVPEPEPSGEPPALSAGEAVAAE
jgi:ParB family chromosome partitioning protein